MKKLLFMMALCALTVAANASTYRYKCGITGITVDTLQSASKNQFTVTFTQKCKNTAEYSSKPEKYYESQVKLVLNSDDRTLDGVYTTEGASTTSSSANVNDQTINLITSEFTMGTTSRALCQDQTSTFVINKIDDTHYSIGACTLYFTQRVNKTDTYIYEYSFDADQILTEGISQTPYVFGWEAGYFEQFYSYDLTVNSLNIVYSPTDYDAIRYFLTMQCTGVNRDSKEERNYEVQLAIYPDVQDIAGSYATQGGTLMYASNCYVKDLEANKQRNLANDSISSIKIASKGNNRYSFTGGPLICTDVDLNYQAVYGKKRIEATHYYYFNDNNGQGIDFSFDGENTELLPNGGMGVDNIQLTEKGKKIILDGKLYIILDGAMYDAQGKMVK